jgi:hypothetical protein
VGNELGMLFGETLAVTPGIHRDAARAVLEMNQQTEQCRTRVLRSGTGRITQERSSAQHSARRSKQARAEPGEALGTVPR